MPPMQVPEGTGWKSGEKPAVTAGLKIEAIAYGLMHPRQLYTLPNGDILVVESHSPGTVPVTTPKQLISGICTHRSGKGTKGANLTPLLLKKVGSTGSMGQRTLL